MGEVSEKLLQSNSDRLREARLGLMHDAWRMWRAAIIRAMACRLALHDDTEPDDELARLHGEMLLCSYVGNSLFASPEAIATCELPTATGRATP